jgi:hypothetical protein
MSLARMALRISTVIALRDATMAQERVRDSALSQLDAEAVDDLAPVITVSTEATERKRGAQMQQTSLVLELALTAKLRTDAETDQETDQIVIGFAETDGELDLMLDLFERETLDALARPDSAAADLFRALCGGEAVNSPGSDYSSIRCVGAAGQRLAVRQILLTADTLLDPVRGEPCDWLERFLDLIEGDPEYGAIHPLLSAFLAGSGLGAAFREQARLFLDAAGAKALGLSPLATDEAGMPVTLTRIAVGGVVAPDDARE